MFQIPAFGVDTGWQKTLPLIKGVIHSVLFQPHIQGRPLLGSHST